MIGNFEVLFIYLKLVIFFVGRRVLYFVLEGFFYINFGWLGSFILLNRVMSISFYMKFLEEFFIFF